MTENKLLALADIGKLTVDDYAQTVEQAFLAAQAAVARSLRENPSRASRAISIKVVFAPIENGYNDVTTARLAVNVSLSAPQPYEAAKGDEAGATIVADGLVLMAKQPDMFDNANGRTHSEGEE